MKQCSSLIRFSKHCSSALSQNVMVCFYIGVCCLWEILFKSRFFLKITKSKIHLLTFVIELIMLYLCSLFQHFAPTNKPQSTMDMHPCTTASSKLTLRRENFLIFSPIFSSLFFLTKLKHHKWYVESLKTKIFHNRSRVVCWGVEPFLIC